MIQQDFNPDPCLVLIGGIRARSPRQWPRELERFWVRQGARRPTWEKEGIVNENKLLSKLWEETGQITIRILFLTCSEGPRGEELVLSGAAFLGTRAVSPQPEGWECQPTQRNTLN